MRNNFQLWGGLFFVGILFFVAFLGPFLPFIDKELTMEGARMVNGKYVIPPFGPSEKNWIGTDRNGVDLLSRIVMGTNDLLLYVFTITLIRYAVAIPFGFFAFYTKFVRLLLDFFNKALSFVPAIFMIILLINMPYLMYSPKRVFLVLIIISLLDVGRVADMIYQQVQMISQKPYIEAAMTIGTRPNRLLKRYYFPLLLPELVVSVILDFGRTMFILGQLGIIGIYISQKIQVIGAQFNIIFEVQNTSDAWPLLFETIFYDIFVAPWIPISACAAITMVILGFFLLAEGLRKYFNKGHKYI